MTLIVPLKLVFIRNLFTAINGDSCACSKESRQSGDLQLTVAAVEVLLS
jgi:hypothetical protein